MNTTAVIAPTDGDIMNVVENRTQLTIVLYDKMYIDDSGNEQYFYPDYINHRPDFEARVLDTCKYLAENGYVGAHISEVTAEPEFNTNYLFK